jgi:glycosyltransferase involved in cell wall biosynthesis
MKKAPESKLRVDHTLKKLRCLYISRYAPERTQTDPHTGLPWYLSRHTSLIGLWNRPIHKAVPFIEDCDQLLEVKSGMMGWLEKLWRILKMAIASTPPDVVVCGIDEPSLILGALLGILRKVPVFTFVEDPPFTDRYDRFTGFLAKMEKRIRTCLLRHLLESCSGLFCFIEKDVLNEFALRKTQVYQMMNGASSLAREFAENKPEPFKTNGEYVVGLVGALTPEQGLDTLLRIIAEVRHQIAHLRLRLIGPLDPGYEKDFHATLKQLNLDLATEVTGWLPYTKMLAHLQGCNVGVYCNPPNNWFRIAQPLKVCEYLALGKPTIAWDYPGVRRLLDGGRLGILVPPGDLRAFAEALVSMGDPDHRCPIEKEIRQAAQEQWASNHWHGKVLEIINPKTFPEMRT